MAYKIIVREDSYYTHYQCSECGAETGYGELRCTASGCGAVFEKGDFREQAKAETETKA